jgi:hypothetical protein
MNIDSDRGVDVLRTESCQINGKVKTVMAAIEVGGFPESGGASLARQDGDQYVLRFRVTDYTLPAVHDKIETENYGQLDVKQVHHEGNLWVIRATGKIKGKTDFG